MSEEEHEMCPNCKRDISLTNYRMHSLHCARHLLLCEICEEPVSKNSIAQHMKDLHTSSSSSSSEAQSCFDCQSQFIRGSYQQHKMEECSKRKLICQYCEIDKPAMEMEAHLSYCGSRTEKCLECNDYVMLKNWKEHQNMRLYHELANKPSSEVFKNQVEDQSCLSKAHRPLLGAISRNNSTSSTIESLPDLEFVSYNSIHSFKAIKPRSLIENRKSSPKRHSFLQKSISIVEEDEVLIPCEFCDQVIKLFHLCKHQNECSKNPESLNYKRQNLLASNIGTKNERSSNESEISKAYFGKDETGNQKRCEDSEYLSPPSIIERRKKGDSIVSKYLQINRQKTQKSKKDVIAPEEEEARSDLREMLKTLRQNPFDDNLESNDGNYFPCEFCGDPFPVEYLMRHQLSCDLNPNPISSGDGFDYSVIRDRASQNMKIE